MPANAYNTMHGICGIIKKLSESGNVLTTDTITPSDFGAFVGEFISAGPVLNGIVEFTLDSESLKKRDEYIEFLRANLGRIEIAYEQVLSEMLEAKTEYEEACNAKNS